MTTQNRFTSRPVAGDPEERVCKARAFCKKRYTLSPSTCAGEDSCRLFEDLDAGGISEGDLTELEGVLADDLRPPKGSYSYRSAGNGSRIRCPRSLFVPFTLRSRCPNEACPYYTDKVAFSCLLLHRDIFFFDDAELPPRLIEIGKGLENGVLDTLRYISVACARGVVATMRYISDRATSPELPEGSLPYLHVCSKCTKLVPDGEECDCSDSLRTRERRRFLAAAWKASLLKADNLLLGPVDLHKLSLKEFVFLAEDYINTPLPLRAALSRVSVEGISLVSLPFGYLYSFYNGTFHDPDPSNLALSLGLSPKLHERAEELFSANSVSI
jgi:hypothetical protein